MAVPADLVAVVEALEATGWAAEVIDHRWHVVWASDEMRIILRAGDDADLGVGHHIMASRRRDAFAIITPETADRWLRTNGPYVMHDTGATADDLRPMLDERQHALLDTLRPAVPPPAWTIALDLEGLGEGRSQVVRLHTEEGRLLGHVLLYGSALPASLLAFVARGDTAHFRRMADLVEPGRRSAAILFADVEGSTDLSRRLPSARYFAAMRRLNLAVDDAILEQGGIVGKHAGDGVSAFFLADQAGGISAAARAGVAAAHAIAAAAAALEGDWRLRIGVHWGATLYMGQIATSGRLEVTALGDEVNECARIQQAARGGQLLASKPLLERLDAPDAAALGVDPSRLAYRLVGELPGVPEKARRDAGALPVAALGEPES